MEPTDNTIVTNFVKSCMVQQCCSQADLSNATGINRSKLGRLLINVQSWTIDVLADVARALGFKDSFAFCSAASENQQLMSRATKVAALADSGEGAGHE